MSVHKHYMAKVLIAEDNRIEAALIEKMLEDFGCEVFKARGLDIVDKLDTAYDLIFLDNVYNINNTKQKIAVKLISCSLKEFKEKYLPKEYNDTSMG